MSKQKRIELKHRNKLLSSGTREDFAEAYDEIHRFFINEGRETIYKDRVHFPGLIVKDKYPAGTKVLEIGTGNGSTAIELAKKGHEVTTFRFQRSHWILLVKEPIRIRHQLEFHMGMRDRWILKEIILTSQLALHLWNILTKSMQGSTWRK